MKRIEIEQRDGILSKLTETLTLVLCAKDQLAPDAHKMMSSMISTFDHLTRHKQATAKKINYPGTRPQTVWGGKRIVH